MQRTCKLGLPRFFFFFFFFFASSLSRGVKRAKAMIPIVVFCRVESIVSWSFRESSFQGSLGGAGCPGGSLSSAFGIIVKFAEMFMTEDVAWRWLFTFVNVGVVSLITYMGMGQNTTTRGPQVLVFGSIYQGYILGTHF